MLRQQQQESIKTIEAIIARGQVRMDAVDAGLKAEVRRERIEEIRAEVMRSLDAPMTEMAARAATAGDDLGKWSQSAARRRAKFTADPTEDATQRTAYFHTLGRTPTGVLIEHLRDAIRDNSLARAEAVRLEFHSRNDTAEHTQEFGRAFGAVVDPEAQRMEAELRQTIGAAEFGMVLIRQFSQGRSDPLARMSAARAAGLVKAA